MSYVITETIEGRVVEVRVSGTLTREAYQEFIPRTEAAIKKHGSIRIVFVMLGFHGWDAGAIWEDIKFDLKHFHQIERLAIVGETKWEKGMSVFCRPFTSASIKYFNHSELDKAHQWINEHLVESA